MKVKLLALASGFFLAAGTAYAGPTPGGPDTDGDTVENAFDNCVALPNAPQTDTNHNGCGDACDPAIACDWAVNGSKPGDLAVGAPDFLILGMNFNMGAVAINTNGDCTGDGLVGTPDYLALGMQFNMAIGPSGITTAQCDPTSCRCTPQ